LAQFEPLEAQARLFHEEQAWDAQAIFLESLNLFALGFLPLEGHPMAEVPAQRVMATYFVQTLASMRAGFDIACQGYYIQALTLVRSTLDDWVGYWYLRNFPGDHWRFVTTDFEPPPITMMLKMLEGGTPPLASPPRRGRKGAIASMAAAAPARPIRETLNRLQPLTHFSRAWAQGPMQAVPTFDVEHLGPRRDEAFFRGTVAEMLEVLGLHLEALDNFRRLAVDEPLQGLDDFMERVRGWQTRQVVILEKLGRA
jgi:hypothetical protein